jgi:hypothetical protein
MQFLREQSYHAHNQTVNITRANLCEIIASKILRRFDEDNPGKAGLLLLANILVAGFEPFQQAPAEVIQENRGALEWAMKKRGGYERTLTALEVAIVSRAKHFLSGSACQKVVDAVYRGRIIYTPTSFIDLIPDYYKHKPVSLYDPRKAPALNQYRLIVPRTRNIIEFFQFLVLFILYCIAMGERDHTRWTTSELVFAIYSAGWCLDEFASTLEHGWDVHTQNLWSFLDVTFVVIYCAYFVARISSWATGNLDGSRQALDLLSVAAPVLLPRLAFTLLPDNMLFISLRAMMADFFVLTILAVWCTGGFLLALRWLATGRNLTVPDEVTEVPDTITIAKWMLWIWFGLDGTGVQEAPSLHMILGPALMVTYAFLGNTLFLTVLVSILSNTFSQVATNAAAEIQYRRAVLTFEGVKSDALFAYRPPFNIMALVFLLPLKFIMTERWFHKTNVAIVRFLNAPILLAISFYERRYLWNPPKPSYNALITAASTGGSGASKAGSHGNTKKRRSFWAFKKAFDVHSDIQAVFDAEPPDSVLQRIEEVDELDDAVLENSFNPGGLGSMSGPSGSTGAGHGNANIAAGRSPVGWRRRSGNASGRGENDSRSRSPGNWRRRWSGGSADVPEGLNVWDFHGTPPRGGVGAVGGNHAQGQGQGTNSGGWRRRLSSVVESL